MEKKEVVLIKDIPVAYYLGDGHLDLMFYGDSGAVSFYAIGGDSFSKKQIAEFTKLRDLIDTVIDDMVSHNVNKGE